MINIKIYDTDIKLRTHYCSLNNMSPLEIKDQYINLYVRFKGCNARCSFCEYYDNASLFNVNKYIEILKYLINKIDIRKLNLTGGEPTLDYDKFLNIFNLTNDIINNKVELTINTNGLNLDKIVKNPDIVNRCVISLSRHHYDDNKNDEIFKSKMITSDEIIDLQKINPNKNSLNITCNLSKGYIDNIDEIYKFLEHANKFDVKTIGFVTLMPINDYCKENYIDFNKLIKDSDRITMMKEWKNKDTCICHNYLYITDNGDILKVYHKNTYDPDNGFPLLVFDGENLKNGFNGEKIK